MTYEVSKEVMNEVIKEFAKTAKKLKGDLVVFTSRLEDEYVIRDIKDFEKLKIKNNTTNINEDLAAYRNEHIK